MIEIVIVGAGQFARDVQQYVRDAFKGRTDGTLKGFLTDKPAELDGYNLDVGVVGSIEKYVPTATDRFVIAVGTPEIHQRLGKALIARGGQFATIIHPTAYVAPTAVLGAGCIVSPFAFVGHFSNVADHVTMNVYSSVGHDARVGSHCVFSPYSVINGRATLERGVFLGTHATVLEGRVIGAESKVAAGAVVYKNVPPHALASGNPASARVMFEPWGASG